MIDPHCKTLVEVDTAVHAIKYAGSSVNWESSPFACFAPDILAAISSDALHVFKTNEPSSPIILWEQHSVYIRYGLQTGSGILSSTAGHGHTPHTHLVHLGVYWHLFINVISELSNLLLTLPLQFL